MTSHDQAVQEVMETFGVTETEAEEIVELEEAGFVVDADGAITDIDPDAPIGLTPYLDDDHGNVIWN